LCGISRRHPYFFREIIVSSDVGPRWKDGDKEAGPALGAVWPHIEGEMIKSMQYMLKETGDKVDKIYVSGFLFSKDEERISKELNIPIERPRFPFFARIGAGKDDKYLPLLMLTLDSLKKPSLNIAPEEILRNDMWGIKFVFLKSFIWLGVILALHIVFFSVNVGIGLKLENSRKNSENYGVINPSSPRENVELHKKSVIESAFFTEDLLSKKRFFTQKLISLNELIPPMAWVESISFTYDTGAGRSASLIIKGAIFEGAAGSVNANRILEAVKADKDIMKGFKEAALSYVEKKISFGREIVEFEIIFK
jgi:hypothetical protein